MANEARTALGLELRAEAAAWLAELTRIDLPDGTQAVRELFQALGELEAEVAGAAADTVELARLQAWLTAGFFAGPDPYEPADVVVQVMNEAQPRERGSSGAGPATPATRATSASTEARGASATGANEFAVGRSQSPPARTAADGPLPRTGAVAGPPAPADARRVDDRRHGWPGASGDAHGARRDEPGQATTAERRIVDRSGAPTPAGGIRGLAALAALAGSGGVEMPMDADRPPRSVDPPDAVDQPRRGSGRAAREAEIRASPRSAYPVDADRDQPSPVHGWAAAVRTPASVDRSVDPSAEAGRVQEVDRAEVRTSVDLSVEAGGVQEVDRDALRLPPRIIRIPFTPQAVERTEDADEGWSAGAPLPIPFLTPDENEQDTAPGTSATGPTPDARQPIAIPTMRVFDGRAAPDPAPAPDARRPAEAEWAGFEAPAESTESFLARAARVAGQRLRPAAEMGGGAAGSASTTPAPAEPSARQISPATAAEPDVYPTVLAREVVPAPRPVDAVEGPAPDVTELLDALASEIAHEYRRYYGE